VCGKPLSSLSSEELRQASDAFASDVQEIFGARKALERRTATGAPSPQNIERQIARWRGLLAVE
jgi:argininosuccinate lyase